MRDVIKTNNLNKSFMMGEHKVDALLDINIKVEAGEFVSIMGPSGSGKSTLLYLLGGLDNPSSGQVYINGKELSALGDKKESIMRRRDMGFVFQFYNLIPNLNLEENVMLPILLDGKNPKKYRDRLAEILEVVGLTGRERHTPRELSGGQQQRVAVARALINQPEVILADEPTGNLDSKTEEDIMGLFQKINKEQGKTIVQVTHSEKCAKYGSRVLRLKDGRVCN